MAIGGNDQVGLIVSLSIGLLLFVGLLVLSLVYKKRIGFGLYVVCLGSVLVRVILELGEHGSLVRLPSPVQPWAAFLASLALVFVALSILDLALVEEYLIAKRDLYVPRVLRLLGILVGLTVAGLVLLRFILDVNVLALIALPTVATAVVGFALKDVIARFVSGIELGRMIRVGDWVTLMDTEGVITDVNLKYVTIKTRGWDYVSLPNDAVTKSAIVNHSRPEALTARTVTVEASYAHPPLLVTRILTEAASAVPGVAQHPPPAALVHEFKESGIEYKVRFWLTDFARRDRIAGEVSAYIWYAFKRNGIEIPYPQRVVHQAAVPDRASMHAAEVDEFLAHLRSVDFLSVLDEEERRRMAEGGERRVFMPGEVIVREGDEGTELFVIMSGSADVEVSSGGTVSKVATMSAGAFFGEMSLLTGAPRSATVRAATPVTVLAIGKEAMAAVLAKNQSLVERLSETLAQRQAALASHRESVAAIRKPDAQADSLSLAARVRKFFGFAIR
jgi:small-conductance mechanosensitive channel